MKHINRFLAALKACLFISIFASNLAFAENASKIGVVDLQKIIQTSHQMKSIQDKLEKEFKPRRDQLVAMEDTLKKDMERFKRDAAILSATEKKNKERAIVALQQKFEREGQQYQQELSTAHNEAMEDLYTKIRKAISTVARQEKYDLILQKDAAPFSVAILDVTELVMKNIDGE